MSTHQQARGEKRVGTTIHRDRLDAVRAKRTFLAAMPDSDFYQRARAMRNVVQHLNRLSVDEAEVFAVVCEVARRRLALDPFDVQVLAGFVLADEAIVELGTGEGKTLAAVAPACLAAIRGRNVHILTFNDYLARRDAAWMRPIYEALGLSVAVVGSSSCFADRRRAYTANVVYVTARQAGFDFLRDHRARTVDEVVLRSLDYAIVDEADSIMIDESRVPMVIAGASDAPPADRGMVSAIVSSLSREHWKTDGGERNVFLTDDGIDAVEDELARRLGHRIDLHGPDGLDLLTEVNQALHARLLLNPDVDYIIRAGAIELVDEFTGRVVRDRRWPDGLQAALESKEGLPVRPGGRVLGTITMQHFLAQYDALSGMTATAQSAVREFRKSYGLSVVTLPPNRRVVRKDKADLVYSTTDARDAAVVSRIREEIAVKRPVLVGTSNVAESNRLGQLLAQAGISCSILNAANDEAEAQVIAGAGAPGAVTISTNMAGRGTDIRLGGADEVSRKQVARRGGLLVLGLHRHESRRIDQQLRGRAGRQGDPGETQFYISLEDPLLRRLGVDRLIPKKLRNGWGAAPLEHRSVRREVERLQRIADGQSREIRSTLLRYSEVVELQRQLLFSIRRDALVNDDTLVQDRRLFPDVSEHFERLVPAVGAKSVIDVARIVALSTIDELWAEHLEEVAQLRESIHLVGIAGLDPVFEFRKHVYASFEKRLDELPRRVGNVFNTLEVRDDRIDLESARVTTPTSTWTYLLNDRVVSDLQQMLFSPGNVGFAAGAVVMVWPLLAVWGLWMRLRRSGRQVDT